MIDMAKIDTRMILKYLQLIKYRWFLKDNQATI